MLGIYLEIVHPGAYFGLHSTGTSQLHMGIFAASLWPLICTIHRYAVDI